MTVQQADTDAFQREPVALDERITADGSSRWPVEPGRYRLIVARGCPWANRAVIVRRLLGLEPVLSMGIAGPLHDARSWRFHLDPDNRDPVLGIEYLREAYLRTDPEFDAGVTVPTVVDLTSGTVATNGFQQLTLDFSTQWRAHHRPGAPDLYPEPLRAEIDEINAVVYSDVNNGVYRCGFARSQQAYEGAYAALFARLDALSQRLATRRYLVGDTITEADVRLWVTLVRFDAVYHGHFKCNRHKLTEMPVLWAYARDLFQTPGFGDTIDFEQINRSAGAPVRVGALRCRAVPTGAREITLRFLAAPTDAGFSGHVSGGSVLEWIDKAGYACAVGWSGSYCVTAYVGDVRFATPVRVGHLVEATGRLLHTGRSSMQVLVTVRSGDPADRVLREATACLMVFVAVDETGRSVAVPRWRPEDPLDREQEANVLRRIQLRRDIEDAMATQSYTDAGTAPRICLRFLAAPTDVNWGGKVHGGKVMRWIDEAAHVLATGWLGSAATIAVYAGGVRFYRPLRIGHLVEVEARLLHTGHSSMHISVHARSGDPATGELELTTHCLIVLVALDADGRATQARRWVPVSAEDVELDAHARKLIELRAAAAGR